MPDISDTKMLNQRDASKELTIIKKYILDRKKWLNDREKQAKKETTANKKKFDARQKEIAEAAKAKEKQRLAEVAQLKRQESAEAIATLTLSSQEKAATITAAPTEEDTQPTPGTSHDLAIEPVVESATPQEEEAEFEDDEGLEFYSPRPSRSRSVAAPITPDLMTSRRGRKGKAPADESDVLARLGALVTSVNKLHKKQDALTEWLVKRDVVSKFV